MHSKTLTQLQRAHIGTHGPHPIFTRYIYPFCTSICRAAGPPCCKSRLKQLSPSWDLEEDEQLTSSDVDASISTIPVDPLDATHALGDGLAAAGASRAEAAEAAEAAQTAAEAWHLNSSYHALHSDWTVSNDADIDSAALQLFQQQGPVCSAAAAAAAVHDGSHAEGSSSSSSSFQEGTAAEHGGSRSTRHQRLSKQQQQQLAQELAEPAAANPSSSSSSSSSGGGGGRGSSSSSTGSETSGYAADTSFRTTGEQDSSSTHLHQPMQVGTAPPAAAAAAAADAEAGTAAPPPAVDTHTEAAAGSFFPSRAEMLQRLQQQQHQLHRQHLLTKQRRNLYQYTLSESGSIVKVASPGPKNPLKQDVFALAKRAPASQQQQQPPGSSSSSTVAADSAAIGSSDSSSSTHVDTDSSNSGSIVASSEGEQPAPQQQQQQQRMQQIQQMFPLQQEEHMLELEQIPRAYQYPSSSPGSSSSSSTAAVRTVNPTDSTSPAPGSTAAGDPSRGLCLSAFLYCCSRSQLLNLTWQLGLNPDALVFVSKVADADLVLHVKPRPGERHYQYEDYRAQAAAKGIPFIDLKSLSLQELQLYLLPVYRLYAGELSPRQLLKRKKPRGRRKHYTSIKLPPA